MTMPFDAYADAPDDALLALYANGDRDAARLLMHRMTPRVYRQAYRMLGDQAEAEDVAQEAMLKLWKIAPDWRQGEAKVTTCLYRIVANLCTDRLRKRRPNDSLDSVAEPEDGAASVPDQMQDQTRSFALNEALDQLPDRQKQAVVLRHLEELTNPEIAEVMGVGVGAVENLIARGKRALAGLLAKRKDELGYSDD
ncbi:MAG: RNA polymerase sigma factor [Paracoccaceae bacterium]|nr:RNA polymerase sigma factor [Paracoccaceae bacterium]